MLNILRFAGEALAGHRLRTGLSIAGLAVGIAAVVTLTALGEGARRYVIAEFNSLGSNLLVVLPGRVETTGAFPFGGVTHDLTLDDVRALDARLERIAHIAPISTGSETVRYGGRGRQVAIIGTSSELQQVWRIELSAGQFLPPGDLDQGGAQVVLGAKVARELFDAESPLGEVVRIGDWRFRVIGVLAPRGRALGVFDLDDLVMVPVSTAMSMFNRSSLFRINMEIRSREEMHAAGEEVKDLLAERHRARDVSIMSQDALIEAFGAILRALTLALGGIASISLLVAGVGIMNVMLVSVAERRSEIGLLKALGVTNRQILSAFLAEAVLLALAGGLTGLVAGYGSVRLLVYVYPAFPATPPLWAVAAAITMALVVGVGFGVWPARRATRLDPVVALQGR